MTEDTDHSKDEGKATENNKPKVKEANISGANKNAEAKATPPTVATKTKTPAPKKEKRALSGLAKITLALSLVASVAALALVLALGWYNFDHYQQQNQERSDLAVALTSLKEQNQTLNTNVNDLSESLDTISHQYQDALERLQQTQQHVAGLSRDIAEISGLRKVDWLLKEAEHFIKLAAQRLALTQDIDGAIALLEEADALMLRTQEPEALRVRQAMSDDLLTLKSVATNTVDGAGIILQLQSQITAIDSLVATPLKLDWQKEQAVLNQETDAQVPMDRRSWKQKMGDFFGRLAPQHYKRSEFDMPMISPQQRAYVDQSLRHFLSQAQLSVLHKDQTTFNVSLDNALALISQYFAAESATSTALIDSLTALRQRDIAPKAPQIQASIRAMAAFRDYWDRERVLRDQQKHQNAISPHARNKDVTMIEEAL